VRRFPILSTAALAGAVALAGAAACGPGGFGGLTGGERDAGATDAGVDAAVLGALAPPRPIGPLSGSIVATARPVLTLRLDGESIGAAVELCRTRACDVVERTFPVEGSTLVVPEDLPAGVWFWRARSRTAAGVGERASATWEIVVRGPAPGGASAAVAGSIVDVNGDGHADVVTVISGPAGASLLVHFGGPDGPTSATQTLPLARAGAAVAAGVDVDGDGYGDVVVATPRAPGAADGGTGDAGVGRFVDVYRGSSKGLAPGSDRPGSPELPNLGESVAAAGDVDLDGYGDVLLTSRDGAVIVLGSSLGLGGRMLSLASAAVYADAPGRVALGGFDLDRDGRSDVIVGSGSRTSPAAAFFRLLASPSLQYVPLDMRDGLPYEGTATAAAVLDLDGDGNLDLAFSAPIKPVGEPELSVLCFLKGPAPAVVPGDCADGSSEFASTIAAADVDGDGRDDLVFGADQRALTSLMNADGVIDFGPSFSVEGVPIVRALTPSRPGPARWLAVTRDAMVVIEGNKRKTTLAPPAGFRFDAVAQ
jgi:hypothetical protein